jgi:hypothetical protein
MITRRNKKKKMEKSDTVEKRGEIYKYLMNLYVCLQK